MEKQLLTVSEAARELGISEQRIRVLLAESRIQGARRHGERIWVIPSPVVVLPPAARPKSCPWRGCKHNVAISGDRRRCNIGLMGVSGKPCPRYEPREGLSEQQRPGWARK
jgi:hypothetical protein